MTLFGLLLQPFADYGFMRRALVATCAIGLGSAPVGTLLVLRRMSLVGDAMAHALLPGAHANAEPAFFSPSSSRASRLLRWQNSWRPGTSRGRSG